MMNSEKESRRLRLKSESLKINYWAVPIVKKMKKNPPTNAEIERQALFIFERVCTYFGISLQDLRSKKKPAQIVKARHMAIYMVKIKMDIPYVQIGELINRDHTSCLYAMDKVEGELMHPVNRSYKNYIEQINMML
jgi:chromosomal replication initiation ATPase DnaA